MNQPTTAAVFAALAPSAQYQVGRHSLWTGDLGVACLLWNCTVEDDGFPTLDRF